MLSTQMSQHMYTAPGIMDLKEVSKKPFKLFLRLTKNNTYCTITDDNLEEACVARSSHTWSFIVSTLAIQNRSCNSQTFRLPYGSPLQWQ